MTCPRCDGLNTIDPIFLTECRKTVGKLIAELVIFANDNKLDHRKMPVLAEVAKVARILEMM